jgi:hypothetical protein
MILSSFIKIQTLGHLIKSSNADVTSASRDDSEFSTNQEKLDEIDSALDFFMECLWNHSEQEGSVGSG